MSRLLVLCASMLGIAACGDEGVSIDAAADAVVDARLPDARVPDAPLIDARQPDAAADAGMCILVPQSGCPTGQKCTVNMSGMWACGPAGSGMHGAACTGTSPDSMCAAGTICLTGRCTQFCRTGMDTDCAPAGAGSRCIFGIMGSTPPARACSTPCDLFNPGTTCMTQDCKLLTAATATGLCITAGSVTEGGACTAIGDCATGLSCVPYMATATCRALCDNDNPCADPGRTCAAFGGTPPPPNGLGACVP